MEKYRTLTEQLAQYPGRWVAWDRAKKRLLAVADSYAEVMEQVADSEVDDLVVEVMPGINPDAVLPPFTLIEGESPQILDDIRAMIPDWERWLDLPHIWFGGRRPRELLGTEDEKEIRYLLRGIRLGVMS
jgi:hypothetical protein